jgi:hypothetical protein
MAIRLPSISLSKYTILVAAQLVLNVSLAVWLYNVYLHNPFMQAYLSSVWSSIWVAVVIVGGVAIGAVAVVAAYSLGRLPGFAKNAEQTLMIQRGGTINNLDTIVACPFCETPLKTISQGRLQCRNCRRYFKNRMPKIPA